MKPRFRFLLLSAAIVTAFGFTTQAQIQTCGFASNCQIQMIHHRNLQFSSFAVINGQAPTASNPNGPESPPVYLFNNPWNVLCPAPAGRTCTFVMTLKMPIVVTAGSVAWLGYEGDGQSFCTDPTKICSGSDQLQYDTNFSIGEFVVAVKNASNDQTHPINIFLTCLSYILNSCSVSGDYNSAAGANLNTTAGVLQVDVYTP